MALALIVFAVGFILIVGLTIIAITDNGAQ